MKSKRFTKNVLAYYTWRPWSDIDLSLQIGTLAALNFSWHSRDVGWRMSLSIGISTDKSDEIPFEDGK